MKILNNQFKNLNEVLDKYKYEYQNAYPFPSIYIDDFINPVLLDKVLEEFPDLDKKDIYYNDPTAKKHASSGDGRFGPYTKMLIEYLNSEEFINFLNHLTGIKEKLIADPYFEGGGFHEIKKGGFLKVHVDFHFHKIMKLDRRLNLLIYLNKEWKEEYGGHFELWEKDMSKCTAKILPIFNRMCLFSTTSNSWHGHPEPLNCNEYQSRKSLAIYYYSDGRPDHELTRSQRNRITTTFVARKGKDSINLILYNFMFNLANRLLPKAVINYIKNSKLF
jgi:hypothetical protein